MLEDSSDISGGFQNIILTATKPKLSASHRVIQELTLPSAAEIMGCRAWKKEAHFGE